MLQERGVATAGELARQIIEEGLWKPTKGGKTPRLTLYSLLYLDSKKKAPHVRKLEGGKWEWRGGNLNELFVCFFPIKLSKRFCNICSIF